MTPTERAAVHRLAGAFGRLSLAAELVAQTPPGRARCELVERMEAVRRAALADFAAAQDALAAETAPPPPPTTSAATPASAAEAPAPSTPPRLAPGAGSGRAVPAARHAPKPGTIAAIALELAARGPFTAQQVATESRRDITVVRSTLSQLQQRGLLAYRPGAKPPGYGRKSTGVWTLPGLEHAPTPGQRASLEHAPTPEQPRSDLEAEMQQRDEATAPAAPKAVAPAPRAAVPGVHRSMAAFFADVPKLPPARPVTPRYA